MISEVKFWNSEKHYGYIKNGEEGDILVQQSELKNCQFLKKNVKVEFDVRIENNRLIAVNVKLIRQKQHSGQRNGNRPHPNRAKHPQINFVMS